MEEDKLKKYLIDTNKELLDSILAANFEKYKELCDSTLTCFEPETEGHLVQGLDFHQYYFNLAKQNVVIVPKQQTVIGSNVRLLGPDAAVVAYVRLIQMGEKTAVLQETRVWQKVEGKWKNVHFHRSNR